MTFDLVARPLAACVYYGRCPEQEGKGLLRGIDTVKWLALASVALGAVSVVNAQGYAWGHAATVGPPGRELHAMAFDPLRSRTVMFGGSSTGSLADTWEWNGASWVPQLLANSPGPRYAHAMVYDSQRNRVIVFGGDDGFGSALGDTWAWDGTSWTQVHVGGPGRKAHSMVYDTLRSRIVVFGGTNGGALGDTWEWDGATWIQRAITGPSPRTLAAMAFDSVRGRTVLFGGSPGALGDTWEWNGTTWTQRSASGPTPRFGACLTFFQQNGQCLLNGGFHWAGGAVLADTSAWDGTAWTPVYLAGPGLRGFHAMVYDSQRRKAVLWGGADGQMQPTDTWELSFSIATTFGSGCGNPPLGLAPVPSSPPLVGTIAQAALANTPSSIAFVALGVSKQFFGAFALPVTLAGIGMPGCDLLQSAEVVGETATPTGAGTANYSFAIPNNTAIVGFHVYLQAWAWAPGVNPANIIVSNGLDWQIGY